MNIRIRDLKMFLEALRVVPAHRSLAAVKPTLCGSVHSRILNTAGSMASAFPEAVSLMPLLLM